MPERLYSVAPSVAATGPADFILHPLNPLLLYVCEYLSLEYTG